MHIRVTYVRMLVIVMAMALSMSTGLSEAASGGEADKALYDKAMKYYYAGKYEESAKLLKEYVKDTADPKAYFRLGYSLYKLGKHDEANKYFEQSYLVTPDYSPTPELEEKHQQLKNVRPEGYYEGKIKEVPIPADEPPAEVPEGMIAVEEASTLAMPTQEEAEEAEAPEEEAVPAEETAAAAPPEPEPAPEPKAQPEPGKPAPSAQPQIDISEDQAKFAVLAIVMSFLIPIIAVFGLMYLLFSLSIFKIAKKLNVDKPFLAWIPIAQALPFTWAAGKPTLWGIILIITSLFLGPVGMIIGLYFWMCISENLGKNKFLGLLMLVPLVNIAFMLYLAFSKGEAGALAPIESPDTQDFSGEPDLDLPDVPDDFDDLDMGAPEDMGDMDDMDFSEPDFDGTDLE